MPKPSTPQLALMLALVRHGGTDVPGRDLFHIDGGIKGTRDATIHACHNHGWVTSRRLDGAVFWSITETGRTAARLADRDGYAQALPDTLTGQGWTTYMPTADRRQIAAAMTGTDLAGLDDERRRAFTEHGITPHAFDRLYPGVPAGLDDELRPHFAHIAAELARVGELHDLDPTAYDPCAPGYRIAVHVARADKRQAESVRLALFHLELGLTSAAHGRPGMALRGAAKAAAALGIGQYRLAA